MEARVVDKRKLPSRHVTEGPEHAPHRSYYYAMGLSPQQIHQPFVGVASCWNEAGGIPMAMKTLLAAGYLHGDCMTVTGRTIAENLKNVKWNSNQDVVYEATEGGPIGLIRGGDIDTTTGLLSVRLDDAILAARKREWKPRENAYKSGAIWKYAQGVGSARKGAVTHPGGAADATTYADI